MKVEGKALILPECVYEASASLSDFEIRYVYLDAVCRYALYGEKSEVADDALQGMIILAYEIMDHYEPKGIIIQPEYWEE